MRLNVIARILGLLAASGASLGADARFSALIKTYGRSEGLPSSQIEALAQDRRGFLWAGTERGLARFDGRRFEAWKTEPTLPSVGVETLYLDGRDRLWLGLSDAGVCALQPDRIAAYCFSRNADPARRLASDAVYAIAETPGRIWLANFGTELLELDQRTLHVLNRHLLQVPEVTAALGDSEGLWLGDLHGGLTRFTLPNFRQTAKALPPASLVLSLARSEHALWVGRANTEALVRVDLHTGTLEQKPLLGSRAAFALLVEPSEASNSAGRIVVGSERGLTYLEDDHWRAERANVGSEGGLPEGNIRALLRDHEGGLWLASEGGGLGYRSPLSAGSSWLVRGEAGLPGRRVNSAALDPEGRLWVATHDAGAAVVFPDGTVERIPVGPASKLKLPRPRVWAVRRSAHGVWLGHQGGLSLYKPELRTFRHWTPASAGNLVDLISPDATGAWAAVGHDQLIHVDELARETVRFGPEQHGGGIEQIHWDDNSNTLWVAGQGGLLSFAAGVWQKAAINELVQAFVPCQGHLMAAGARHLYQLSSDAKSALKRWPLPPALHAFNVGGLSCDRSGQLWSAGPTGIWRWLEAQQWLRKPDAHGLFATEFSDRPFATSDGAMLIGSQHGLLRLDPEVRALTPNPFLLSLEPEFSELDLDWRDPTLRIKAVALSFLAPDENEFNFEIPGLVEGEWTREPFRHFERLPAGTWQLHVNARNPLGLAAAPQIVTVRVEQAPWQRTWAHLLILLLLSAGTYLFWRYTQLLQMRKRAFRQSRLHAYANEHSALARTETLSYVSHEMRNLLNGVTGNAQLLRSQLADLQTTRCIDRIEEAGERLAGLLDDALDFSKLEINRFELNETSFDLAEVLQSSFNGLRELAVQRGLDYQSSLQLKHPHRYGDPARVRQIVSNLLSNALKFTERGTVTLRVREQDSQVQIEVEDTGPGIALLDQPQIFRPYIRVGNARMTRGSGLGLPISAALATRMSGSLRLQHSDAHGSCFALELRLPIATEAAPRRGQTKPTALGALRILVVEDEASNQALLLDLLARHGHQVSIAGDALAALTLASDARFDVVLLDLDLPQISGLELAPMLKAQAHLANVPIIAVSGRAQTADRSACHEAGIVGFAEKPYNLPRLLSEIHAACTARAESLSD